MRKTTKVLGNYINGGLIIQKLDPLPCDSIFPMCFLEFLKLLCSEVAPRTNQWRAIALNLDFDPVMVNRIALECRDDIQECFVRVFEQWHRQCDPPYTWNTITDVLEQPPVNEAALAQELRQKYC